MNAPKHPPALFLTAVLEDRRDFTEWVARFRFAVEGKLDFAPGQYATLAREREGKLLQRPYSICSAPGEDRLEFYCDLVPGGAFSPIMWHMEVGERVQVRRRVAGRFTLAPPAETTRHLMAATVTGAAPFISMIRDYRARRARGGAPEAEFLLVHGCSRSAELGTYFEELSDLARESWFHYVPTVSRPAEDPAWRGETGRVEDVIRKHADALGYHAASSVGYACGNPDMVANVRAILRRTGFPEGRIREEKYYESRRSGLPDDEDPWT